MPDMEYSLCKDIGPKKIGQVNNSQRLNNRVDEGVAARDCMSSRLTKHNCLFHREVPGYLFCGY